MNEAERDALLERLLTGDLDPESPEALRLLADDGARVWGRSSDPALTAALLADEDVCGRRARVRDGELSLD